MKYLCLSHVINDYRLTMTGRNYWIPHNVNCYKEELFKLLTSTQKTFPIVIIIDGVDEVQTYINYLFTFL